MANTDIATVLALGAALFIAIGDVIQQRSAHNVTDEPVSTVGLFVRLLRDRSWWLGSLVAAGGFALQAAALNFGSVVLVAALLVSSLLFALPINAFISHHRVTRWQWLWAVLLSVAMSVIVTVGDPQAGFSRASLQAWLGVSAVLVPTLVLCVIGARLWSGSARAVLLAFVSGALWGVFAVLTKAVVVRLDHGIPALLHTPELYAWALVAIAATAYQQSAFRAGALTASLPTVTVTEPVVGSVLGIVLLGERLNTNGFGMVALGVSAAVMVAATAVLARSSAAATSEQSPGTPAAAPAV